MDNPKSEIIFAHFAVRLEAAHGQSSSVADRGAGGSLVQDWRNGTVRPGRL